MSSTWLAKMIARQGDLIQALDSRDIDGINVASAALAEVVQDADRTTLDQVQLDLALKQSNALKIRVNTLSDWTRQRIDRLAEIQGRDTVPTYSNTRKSAIF